MHIIMKKKINVYLCEKTSLKYLILQQGKTIYTDSVFAGFIKQSLLKCPQIAHDCLASVTATIRSLLPLTGFHSSHNVKQSTISNALSANKCALSQKQDDGTGYRYYFTLQKEERVIVPAHIVLNMWPNSTDDKCMSPSLNPLSRLPSSSWLMRTRLN